jgi:hypothetical protein
VRIYRHLTANEIQLEPFPFKRELSMEAYLIENEGVLALDGDVFGNVEIIEAELSLKRGRTSKDTDGRIDVLATYSQEYIAVIELKLGTLTQLHRRQLEDYLMERGQLLEQYPNALNPEAAPTPKWIGVLVGSAIDPELAEAMRAGATTTQGIPLAALTVQRFRGSDGTVIVSTDVYFRAPGSTKDTTRYEFNGETYGKGRLVLAIVKRYVADHPGITYAQLEEAFPGALQGSLGVVATIDAANRTYASSGRKRHFLEQEEQIELADSKIAVCSQWGVGNIDRLLGRADFLGYTVKPSVS